MTLVRAEALGQGGQCGQGSQGFRESLTIAGLFTWLLAWLSSGIFLATAHAAGLPPTVTQALASAHIPAGSVSVVVAPLDGATPTLALNEAVARNPASVIKLVTTLAALEQLGPAYVWKTEFLIDAPVQGGRLDGPLYLRGSGDPRLTYERLWLMLRQLRDFGIREITGDLVLDRSAFAPVAASPGAFDGKPLRPYNALPDALLFNFNAVSLRLRPDDAAGDGKGGVTVTAQPAADTLVLDNRLRLSRAAQCGDWREALTATLTPAERGTRLSLRGDYPAVCGERDWHIQALRADDLLAGSFRALWLELGGRFSGRVREGRTPAEARSIAVPPALTLSEVVRDINKYSNNVLARQLFLTLGREARLRAGQDSPASDGDGSEAIRAWQVQQGLELPELELGNGSGLARETRITASGLATLLRHAWRSPVMPEFMASLPVAAVDGTMKKRGRDTPVAGRAHIKTGSLEGVKTLAGYVLDTSGRRHLVVFLVNHAQASSAQPAMDALLAWIVEGAV